MQERGSSEGTAAWKRGTEIPREAPREEGSKREVRSQVGREPWGAGRGEGEGGSGEWGGGRGRSSPGKGERDRRGRQGESCGGAARDR